MRRRDDHAAVGPEIAHEQRDGGRRDDAREQRVGTAGAEAGDECGFEQIAAATRVAPDDDATPPLVAEEVPGGLAEFEDEFGRELDVGDAAHTVGAEESCHRAP